MENKYLNKDFFLQDDGKLLFDSKTSEKVAHVCITDDTIEPDFDGLVGAFVKSITPFEIVVGLGDYIPLWDKNVILKWRLSPSFNEYSNSENVKNSIRELFEEALSQWGDASPIKFEESIDNFDFEIIMRPDSCNINGCTLASAFFPNSSIKVLALFPKIFTQSKVEQVETLVHEIGHIFGLRHYFAKELEGTWRSEIFGDHNPLTIMNYGNESTLTEQDRIDLKKLYSLVWNKEIDNINGLPIKLFNSLPGGIG